MPEGDRSGAALPGLLLVASGGLLFPSSGRDDLYLTLWPAHTLATQGAILNVNGEAVEQSSSLLQVVLLGALDRLVPLPLPTLAWLAGVAAAVGCVLLTARVAARLGPEYRGAAWLVATATPLVYWSFSGMETSLAALLGLAVVAGWSGFLGGAGRRWPAPAAWLATLAFLAVRPEAVAVLACTLAGALVLALRVRDGSAGGLARLGLVTAAGFALLAAVRLTLFGALFPQPVIAKAFVPLAGEGLAAALRSGSAYALASLASPFALAVWLGLAAAVLAVLAAAARRSVPAFERIAALFCLAYLGFVCTTGGDWMEGGRLLVPWLPPLLLLAAGALGRRAGARRGAAIASLAVLQLAGTVAFARSQSTGVPLWQLLAHGAAAEAPFGWSEAANRVHQRDAAPIAALGDVIERIARETGQPVVLLSGQMGMVAYYLALEHPGRVRFIDADGLATRQVTRKGFAGLRAAWQHSWWEVLRLAPERLETLLGTARPDVIYDLGGPPPDLASRGYVVAFEQHGPVPGAPLLPGRTVSSNAYVAVRADHREALAAPAR